MSDLAVPEASTFPAAELDRRFYAFTIDRLIAWTVDAMAALAAYHWLIATGHVAAGIAVIVAVVLLVGLGLALLQGARGISPGKSALGLRVVHIDTGTPIGAPAGLVRGCVLGVATLPTLGLGVATLAWTAVMDPGRQRRGWHDHRTRGIVVDVRPIPVQVEEAPSGPRHVVNLTAMRLVPAPQPVPVPAPARAPRPPEPPVPTPAPTAASPVVVSPTSPPPTGFPPVGPPAAAPGAVPGVPHPAERTVVRGRGPSPARWRVTFDSGESFLVEGLALVGRRPEPRPGEPVRHLLPLRSDDMSLSKTHAQFQVAPDGVLVVMDRGSTNGSLLVRQGVSRQLTAGRPATLLDGDRVRFGDREMTVAHEA